MEFTFRLENDRGSHHWLVIGKYHWFNLNIDVPNVYGHRSPFSGMDLADYEQAFEELRSLGVKYTNEIYTFVKKLGDLRKKELVMFDAIKKGHPGNDAQDEARQRFLMTEAKGETKKQYEEIIKTAPKVK